MKKSSQDIPAPVAILFILGSMAAAGWQLFGLLQTIAGAIPNFFSPYEAMLP